MRRIRSEITVPTALPWATHSIVHIPEPASIVAIAYIASSISMKSSPAQKAAQQARSRNPSVKRFRRCLYRQKLTNRPTTMNGRETARSWRWRGPGSRATSSQTPACIGLHQSHDRLAGLCRWRLFCAKPRGTLLPPDHRVAAATASRLPSPCYWPQAINAGVARVEPLRSTVNVYPRSHPPPYTERTHGRTQTEIPVVLPAAIWYKREDWEALFRELAAPHRIMKAASRRDGSYRWRFWRSKRHVYCRVMAEQRQACISQVMSNSLEGGQSCRANKSVSWH